MRQRKMNGVVQAAPAQWRQAFDYANRVNAIEGIYPSEFGLQVQELVAVGRVTIDEAVAMITRHHGGRLQS